MKRLLDVADTEKKIMKKRIQLLEKKLEERQEVGTPTKEALALLSEEGITPKRSLVKKLLVYTSTMKCVATASQKTKRLLFSVTRKNVRAAKSIAKRIGLSRQYVFHQVNKKTRRRVKAKEVNGLIIDFLKRSDNSAIIPDTRDHLKGGCVQKYGLSDTMSNLYLKFKAEHPGVKASKAHFYKQKPYFIRHIRWTNRKQNLCQSHSNMSYLLRAVKELPKSTERICTISPDELEEKLQTIPEGDVNFTRWQKKDVLYNGTVLKKVKYTKTSLQKEEFIDHFKTELLTFRAHTERVHTQYTEILKLKEHLVPMTEATIQMDYSENYSCTFNEEISQVFYDKMQVTLHPMVVHWRNENAELVHKSYCGISEERAHTVPTTFTFIKQLIPAIKNLIPDLKIVHYITDSPSSQYRNRTMVAVMAHHPSIFGVLASYQWLETGHGKGPCDGIGGTIKKMAETAIKKGVVVISNAEEMGLWAETCATKIDFFNVSAKDVANTGKEIARWNVEQVKGLLTTHALIPYDNTFYIRDKSCFSPCCYNQGKFTPSCDGWKDTQIKVGDDTRTVEVTVPAHVIVQAPTPVEEGVVDDVIDSINDLPTIGTYVAAKYGAAKKMKWYVGKVLDVDAIDNDVLVTFMSSSKGRYKWGANDEVWVQNCNILCNIEEPIPSGNYFTIEKETLIMIDRKFTERI